MILLQRSQNKILRPLCVACPAILFLTLNALPQIDTQSNAQLSTSTLSYGIQYAQPLCYALFALKPLVCFTPLTNFPSHIFGFNALWVAAFYKR